MPDMVPYLALKRAAGNSDEPIFFSVSESEQKAIDIDNRGELTNTNCWATPQGWVLVRDAVSASTYLMDPHHTSRIPLPHLSADGLSTYCTCLLSDHLDPAQRSSSGLVVLLVETDSPVIWYCRIGGDDDDDEQWVKHEYDIGSQDLPDLGEGCSEKLLISPIAACGGKFFFNGSLGEVGVLEFRPGPVFGSVAIRDPVEEDDGFEKVFMVESGGRDLYMVSLLSSLDSTGSIESLSIGWISRGRNGAEWMTLVIGRSCCPRGTLALRVRQTSVGLERSCVYSANPWDKCVRVYNIKDGTTKVHDLKGAPAVDQALWMLPTQKGNLCLADYSFLGKQRSKDARSPELPYVK